jgi:mannitol/fructose-specific phosphotransferase system IIA component
VIVLGREILKGFLPKSDLSSYGGRQGCYGLQVTARLPSSILAASASMHAVPRIGELLVRAGLVPRARLDEALARQAGANRRLGELLVEMGLLDRVELDEVLAIQDDLRAGRGEELRGLLASRLGDILLNSAAVTQAQLDRAVAEQERTGELLGEILVRQGAITPAQRQGALSLQGQVANRLHGRARLGRMLVEAGVIDETTLEEAIQRQRASGKRLGETLVESGAITPDVLSGFLARQKRLRAIAFAAAALGISTPPAAHADTHRVNVQAVVLRHASISAIRAPRQITVTNADIARGYVELEQPVEVVIRTNNPTGVMLGFNLNSAQVRAAHFVGEDLQLSVATGAAVVLVPKAEAGLRSQTLHLRTRLELAPGAQPGVIAWPVALFIAPS